MMSISADIRGLADKSERQLLLHGKSPLLTIAVLAVALNGSRGDTGGLRLGHELSRWERQRGLIVACERVVLRDAVDRRVYVIDLAGSVEDTVAAAEDGLVAQRGRRPRDADARRPIVLIGEIP